MDLHTAREVVAQLFQRDPKKAQELLVRYCCENENVSSEIFSSISSQGPSPHQPHPAGRGSFGPSVSPFPHELNHSGPYDLQQEIPRASSSERPPSPPRTEVSHSTKGDTAHKEYIYLLLNTTGDSVEEQTVQMKTASIKKSVIRHNLVSEDELDANMLREEGQVDIPLDADTETTTAVRYCGIVKLTWRRRKSSKTHRTRFYIVPDKILNYDIMMSYADSGIEHPPPIAPPLRSSETRYNSGQRPSGTISPQASHHRSSDTNNDSSRTAPTQYQIRNNNYYFDTPVIPEATDPGPSAPGGSIRNHHYPHPISSNRFPGSQPTQHEISQPSPHRATDTTFASINSVSDPQPDVRSDKLRIAIKWDETRFHVWLFPDGPCQAFFEEFQSHARKRKRVLDRTITSILFKEDEEASDAKSHELSLDEDSLDADWKEIVKWLGRNKKKEPPHIFGTVLVDDE